MQVPTSNSAMRSGSKCQSQQCHKWLSVKSSPIYKGRTGLSTIMNSTNSSHTVSELAQSANHPTFWGDPGRNSTIKGISEFYTVSGWKGFISARQYAKVHSRW